MEPYETGQTLGVVLLIVVVCSMITAGCAALGVVLLAIIEISAQKTAKRLAELLDEIRKGYRLK
jgi:hypothetical protein